MPLGCCQFVTVFGGQTSGFGSNLADPLSLSPAAFDLTAAAQPQRVQPQTRRHRTAHCRAGIYLSVSDENVRNLFLPAVEFGRAYGHSASDEAETMNYFPTTHWSVVLHAGAGDPEKSADALAALCRVYWYPIYALARSLGDSHQDAQDLAQGFSTHLVKSKLASKAHPEAGRFRSFLHVSFRNFRSVQLRHARADKRGGAVSFLPLGDFDPNGRYSREPQGPVSPEERFDRNWALSVIDRAHRALAQEYVRTSQQQVFARLSGFLPGHDAPEAYEQLARDFGKSVTAVRMDVSRFRKRYMAALQAVVAETVSTPAEVKEELRYLLQILLR
jgi:RNA polymerase sigma-70 factor (ECF subfamily)